MIKGFWGKLKKPFFVLAPMHEVSDSAFRKIVIHCGRPDVVFAEFVSVDALCNLESRKKITEFFLRFDKETEHPIVAQLWGSDPEKFEKAALYIKSLGFDGIDINMGCPSKNVVNQGGGADLIQNPQLAVKIIEATKKGAGKLPVSVKTRIGYNKIDTEKWIKTLIKGKPDVITIHGRTRKEMSKVPAHWDEIGKSAKILNKAGIMVIGNGDIKSLDEAGKKARQYKLDGVMIGRAVLGNPWFFNSRAKYEDISAEEKLRILIKHARLFEQEFKNIKKFFRFRKMIAGYISGFEGARELRNKLMQTKNASEVEVIIKRWNMPIRHASQGKAGKECRI
jgi:nifR3 family TIM-barrel protein